MGHNNDNLKQLVARTLTSLDESILENDFTKLFVGMMS